MTDASQLLQWQAKWIWARDAAALPNAYVLARRRIVLEVAPVKAVIHLAAKERYWLYVNGEYVSDGPPSCHPQWQYYDTHDITDHLGKGDNAIAMFGYNGAIPTHPRVGGPGGLLAQLHIEDAHGDRAVVITDDTW